MTTWRAELTRLALLHLQSLQVGSLPFYYVRVITDIGQVGTFRRKDHRPFLQVRRRSLPNEFLDY